MTGFAENILDLIKGLIILIVGIYIISAIIKVLDFSNSASQFLSSIGFGALVVGVIVIFLIVIWREL